jgi:hypothetical protein
LERIWQLVEWPNRPDQTVEKREVLGAVSVVAQQHLHGISKTHCFAPFGRVVYARRAFVVLDVVPGGSIHVGERGIVTVACPIGIGVTTVPSSN